MNTSKIINAGLYGVTPTGQPGTGFIDQLINKAIDELKIEKIYNYSYEFIYDCEDFSPICIIKLLNINNKKEHIINVKFSFSLNPSSYSYILDKIKINIKQHFRNINLNKLV